MNKKLIDEELMDYFAAAAITGLLSQDRLVGHEKQAAWMAYDIAKHMINERRRLHDERNAKKESV